MSSPLSRTSRQEREIAQGTATGGIIVVILTGLAVVAVVLVVIGLRWPGNAKKSATTSPKP